MGLESSSSFQLLRQHKPQLTQATPFCNHVFQRFCVAEGVRFCANDSPSGNKSSSQAINCAKVGMAVQLAPVVWRRNTVCVTDIAAINWSLSVISLLAHLHAITLEQSQQATGTPRTNGRLGVAVQNKLWVSWQSEGSRNWGS